MSKNDVAKHLYNSLEFNEFKVMLRKEIGD
jgi:hypothetical protein